MESCPVPIPLSFFEGIFFVLDLLQELHFKFVHALSLPDFHTVQMKSWHEVGASSLDLALVFSSSLLVCNIFCKEYFLENNTAVFIES